MRLVQDDHGRRCSQPGSQRRQRAVEPLVVDHHDLRGGIRTAAHHTEAERLLEADGVLELPGFVSRFRAHDKQPEGFSALPHRGEDREPHPGFAGPRHTEVRSVAEGQQPGDVTLLEISERRGPFSSEKCRNLLVSDGLVGAVSRHSPGCC